MESILIIPHTQLKGTTIMATINTISTQDILTKISKWIAMDKLTASSDYIELMTDAHKRLEEGMSLLPSQVCYINSRLS